jgi:hypothetical protein
MAKQDSGRTGKTLCVQPIEEGSSSSADNGTCGDDVKVVKGDE